MRIAFISAGAGGMYCGSCIHDNTLAAALQRKGCDVALIPTYTPLRTDEANVSIDRIFYGGIHVYLQQKLALFRHTPWILDRLMDPLVKGLSRLNSSTDPKKLGALTVSVLQGEEGRQHKELEKLISWLKSSFRPDIVHLTNSLFSGLTRRIKEELGVPVLCAVQGEDLFLDGLAEPHRSQALNLVRERAIDVDGFIAPCRFYAEFIKTYLKIPEGKVHEARLGLNLQGHGTGRGPEPSPFSIGYLARICPEKGLHLLVDAFYLLTERVGRDNIRLKVAGYLGKKDRAYFDELRKQIDLRGLAECFEYAGEIDRNQKIEFLNRLHVLSVPTLFQDPKGLFILEALANGIPVVQPRHGAFPELVEATGGGILVEPGSPDAIAEGILQLLEDPEYRSRLGQAGKEAVERKFNDAVMADETIEIYRKYTVPCPKVQVPC